MIEIKKYPHLVEQIDLMWGHDQFRTFFNILVFHDRQKGHGGFTPAAFSELIFIAQVHEMLYGL